MRLQCVGAIAVALLWQSYPAHGQDSLKNQYAVATILSEDINGFWHDAGRIFGAPLRFRQEEWIRTNLAFAGTTLLLTEDPSVRSFAGRNHSLLNDRLADVGEQYGRNVNVLLITGGIYLGGLLFKDEGIRTTGRMALESALFAGLVTTVFKSLIGRSRPYAAEGAYKFSGWQFSDQRLSLPSGHATLAFAISSVLANRIHNPFASVGLYALATFTAASRVYHDDHWVSDTFLGAVIGTSVGCTISSIENPGENPGNESILLHISPIPSGVRIELTF